MKSRTEHCTADGQDFRFGMEDTFYLEITSQKNYLNFESVEEMEEFISAMKKEAENMGLE